LDFSQPAPWHFYFYRFVMVVRKNVLEYIIALVVVKNKVRLKKGLKKFQIWQSSIVQINLFITSLRLILKFRPVFELMSQGGSLRSAHFFKCAPPLTWNPGFAPYWPQYVHYQCHSRRWIQNWSVWDIYIFLNE
jgi:hypothetical protein